MLNYCLKVLLVFFVTLLSFIWPAFADVDLQMEASTKYFDDLQEQDTFESYKVKRDLNTQRIRETILQKRSKLKHDNSDLAKAVIDRKVRIARESEFLVNEFVKGVEALYQKAVDAYSRQEFRVSQKDFVAVDKLFPNYRDTRHYLEKLQLNLPVALKDTADITAEKILFKYRQKRIDDTLRDLQVANLLGDQK